MRLGQNLLQQGAAGGGGGEWVTDLANASYDNISFSVAEEAVTSALVFNAEGTKFYTIGYINGDRVRSYSLTTGFDLTTASFDGVFFNIGSQDNQPRGLAFNNDFSKMYIVGLTNDTVYQYSLSTAGDITTASYDGVSFSIAAQQTNPDGVFFNDTGSKMYVVGIFPASLHQYSLSTPFDLSTASYDSVSLDVSAQDTSPRGATFNPDGSKLYLVGQQNDSVYQYSISTPFDLSTASYDSVSFNVAAQETSPTDVAFNTDGSKMYVVGVTIDLVHQYSTA